jgi:hypothetical protein
MSDQLVAKASTHTGQHNTETQETNIHVLSGIRTRDFRNQAAADLRLRPHGHRNRLMAYMLYINFYLFICSQMYN